MKGEKKNKKSQPKVEKIGFSSNSSTPNIEVKISSKKIYDQRKPKQGIK